MKTLRPPTPRTECVAHIRVRGDALCVALDERDDTFRTLVKAHGFQWDRGGQQWWRRADVNVASLPDLAAEIGHLLLLAGFPVEVEDAVMEAIATVAYRPEKRLWIGVARDDKYAGWLAIVWPRDEDYYAAARRIPGSRYGKPHVVVPPERYEEVEDFAERHGFWISPAAQTVIDKAAERRRTAILFEPPPLPAGPAAARSVEFGLDPELADDDDSL